ncbi:MAG TPA: GHMP kinase [Candidatus Hydrogenedentes bacterium]|nr:GHMP kinase [Candidatus Hydrogenedentota bacterium]HPG69100.1 GHMP kinase [Candidatus Hydrogenedentota bacterium]
MACEATAYARAGLAGNPSDGYYGKTISFIVRNFWARVSLYESTDLEIVPSFQDRSKYPSVHDLVEDVKIHGYYGGIRLMKATVRRFIEYCDEHGIDLPKQNFSIRYRSNIPRHLGLAGSSALVTATLRCLMEFYEVEIPKSIQPNVVLSVEKQELKIAAGLQDRVIQVYEGLVFMDFDKALLDARGHGAYEELDPALLPNLFLAYRTDLAEGSETFHNNILDRWLAGEADVVQAMKDFAGYAQEVRDLLVAGRGDEIGPWLDRNFDRRKSIYNLDPKNVDMVERARSAGASCKFTGSGGAIVGVYKDEAMYRRIEEAFMGSHAIVLKPVVTE